MSISITSPMRQSCAADYIAKVCGIAIDVACAMLNTARCIGRLELPDYRLTITAKSTLDDCEYRVFQAIC